MRRSPRLLGLCVVVARARRANPSPSPAPSTPGGGAKVPKTVVDATWSLRPYPAHFVLGGIAAEVPALPAVDWLEILMSDEFAYMNIIPGLLREEDQPQFMDAILDGHITLEDIKEQVQELITTVGSRPWWVTFRIVGVMYNNWHTLGAEMLMRGADAERLSFSGWLDVALLLIMRNIDPKEATMFSMKLEMVPPEEVKSQPEPVMSASQFMSMA